jgi:hypothetical protein
MIRSDVLYMIKRRAKGAGLPHSTCCHTFRATWITAYLQTAARWSMHSKSPRTSRHVPPNCTIGPGMRFRWTRLSESNSEGIVPHTKGHQVSAEKIARRECGSLTQRREQSHSRGGRRPTRTRPGSTTVKPSRSRAPSSANASTTASGFAAARAARELDEHHTRRRMPARVDQLAEIAVLSYQHASLGERRRNDRLVARPRCALGDREHVVARGA